MRRIALISDVHGNTKALDAVLAEIGSSGVGSVFCLGDLIGYGPDPSGVVERIRALGMPSLLGNYDEGVASRSGDCGCFYPSEQARADGEASYEFTTAAVSDSDAEWLLALPREFRVCEMGVRLLFVHGSPRKLNEYLLPDRSATSFLRIAREAEADVVCVGHVHVPYHLVFERDDGGFVHFVSAGSVGKARDEPGRACWVELLVGDEEQVRSAASDSAAAPAGSDGAWLGISVHHVDYDVESVAAAMREEGLPETLVASMLGL